MCELLGLSSNQPATVNVSIGTLAEHGSVGGSLKDGWGIAYYEGKDIRLIKDADSAYDSDWIRFIREHKLRSHIVIAHVRTATVGSRAYRNTQPFTRELAGRMHAFAHNGSLPALIGSGRLGSQRFHPVGETDSEVAFCQLLEQMTPLWGKDDDIPELDARLAIVSNFAAGLRTMGPANFLYSDGDVLFAHGHRRRQAASPKVKAPGLVYLQRVCHVTEHTTAVSGLSFYSPDQSVALIASVPLNGEGWSALAEGEVIALRNGEIVARRSATSAETPMRGS
jgi:glutamine amidotransferase